MFLSMIIPVYNTETYLAACLDACLQQDIPAEDYEIICVNDGSTDRSGAILEAYSGRYPQIQVITQANAGVSSARNAGLDAAGGDYVWFIDSDDVIAPNCLKGLRETCLETNCDRLGFSLILVDQNIPSQERLLEMIASPDVEKQTYEYGYMVLTVMRREFLLSHHIRFLPQIAYGEDMVFNYTWDLHSYQFAQYDKVLYFYRCNPASAMQTLTTSLDSQIKRFRSIMQILLWLRENGQDHMGTGKWKPDLAMRYSQMLHMLIHGLLPDMPHRTARELWKEIRTYRLTAGEYLYIKNKDGQMVLEPFARQKLLGKYVLNRIRFCIRHPIQWLLG